MKSEAAVLSIQSVVQYREVDDDVAYVQDVDNKVRLTRKRPRLIRLLQSWSEEIEFAAAVDVDDDDAIPYR